MASEVTYLHGKNIWGLTESVDTPVKEAETVDRLLVAVRPTRRVNDNFRWEFTASYGYDKSNWSAQTTTTDYYTAEIAGVITVNADYFSRPQIKPFVTYLYKDAKDGWGADFDNEKGVLQFGVEAEIWF